jgi:hypothetical protein
MVYIVKANTGSSFRGHTLNDVLLAVEGRGDMHYRVRLGLGRWRERYGCSEDTKSTNGGGIERTAHLSQHYLTAERPS